MFPGAERSEAGPASLSSQAHSWERYGLSSSLFSPIEHPLSYSPPKQQSARTLIPSKVLVNLGCVVLIHWPVVNPCTCWQDYILCSNDHTYANSPSSSQNIGGTYSQHLPRWKDASSPAWRSDRRTFVSAATTGFFFFRSAPRHRVAGGADLFETCPTSQQQTSSVSKQPRHGKRTPPLALSASCRGPRTQKRATLREGAGQLLPVVKR